jgi:hypothetical protein
LSQQGLRVGEELLMGLRSGAVGRRPWRRRPCRPELHSRCVAANHRLNACQAARTGDSVPVDSVGCRLARQTRRVNSRGLRVCSSLVSDDHHRRTKMLSAVFAVTDKRTAMSARKVSCTAGMSIAAASGDPPDLKSAGGEPHESPARYLPRAGSAPELPKRIPPTTPLFPKTGARSTTDSIEARCYGRLCDRGKERRRSLTLMKRRIKADP